MKLFNKNTKAGFTLVELIVVIAILGILAGIAIPVYSGYIKKANQAADNVLLGAVNTAFAAACIENGTTNTAQPGNVSLQSGQSITTVSGTTDDTAIPASFVKYFAGNDGALKYYKNDGDIVFYQGMFVSVDSAGVATASWTVGGQTFTMSFSNADIANVNASTFVNDGLGVDTLLEQVNAVTTLASNVLNSSSGGKGDQLLNGIISSPEFLSFAADKLGGTLSAEQLAAALTNTLDPSTLNEEQIATLEKLTTNPNTIPNALVLYAAEQSAGLSQDSSFHAELAAMDMDGTTIDGSGASIGGDMLTLGLAAYNSIYGEGGSPANAGSALAKAAYGYGMSIAYGNYKAQDGNSDVTWQEYLASDQGKADFAAYASCMDMINSNATSADVTTALLSAGFGDDNLAAAIIAALGGN